MMSRMITKSMGCALLLSVLLPQAAQAQFLDGFNHFQKGEFCEAREAWLDDEPDGDSSSAFGIAETYSRGLCVQEDQVKASRWYLTAALRGFSRGRAEIGIRYAYGKGVEPNAYKSYVWLSIARLTAAKWETDFRENLTVNINLMRQALTAAELAKANKAITQYRQTYRMPREFEIL
jgi:TPR repeat protein